jgi:hypothetical protein
VIGALDPGDDGDAQLAASSPAPPVEDVFLEQCKEGLHGGVVARRADLAHGADHVMAHERTMDLACAKLAAAIGVQDAAGDAVPAGSGILERPYRQTRLHSGIDRVTDDPV